MNRNIAIVTMISAFFLVISSAFSANTSPTVTIDPYQKNEPSINSGVQFWIFDNLTIHINNNWSLTESTYPWCEGSGSWNDPYLIENITIDGMQVRPCIVIENTREYFLIRNCTLLNATCGCGSAIIAGINFNNVTNGSILDNRIYSNNFGVWGNSSSNITISGNSIRSNTKEGICLKNCLNIKVRDNLIQDNKGNGIYLSSSSQNIINDLNIIHRNKLYGIYLTEGSNNNNVSENYFGYNVEGCVRDDGEDNTFERNDCVGDYDEETNYGELEEQEIDITTYVIVAIATIAGLVVILLVLKIKRKRNLNARETAK